MVCECLQVDSLRTREEVATADEIWGTMLLCQQRARTYWTKCQEILMKTRQRFFLIKPGRDNKVHWSTSACTLPTPGLQPLSQSLKFLRQKDVRSGPGRVGGCCRSTLTVPTQSRCTTKKPQSYQQNAEKNETKTQRCLGLNRFEQKKINPWWPQPQGATS